MFDCRVEYGQHRVSCEEASYTSGTLGGVADVVDEPVTTLGPLLSAGDERRVVAVFAARVLSHLST